MTGKKTKKNVISKIKDIQKIEEMQPSRLKRYGNSMEAAVNRGDYTLTRPHQINHLYQEGNKSGTIYILSSPTRPGQIKLGATTMNISDRCARYESKYGYKVNIEKFMTVLKPFELEKLVKLQAKSHRVTANACGDSIEWYQFLPMELWDLVMEINAQRQG